MSSDITSKLEDIVKRDAIKTPINQHIMESANNFYDNGLSSIICDIFKIENHYDPKRIINRKNNTIDYDKPVDYSMATCTVKFTSVSVGRPVIQTNDISKTRTNNTYVLYYPTVSNRDNKNYVAPVTVSCEVSLVVKDVNGNDEPPIVKHIEDMLLFDIPVIVKSNVCNLYNVPPEVQLKLGEDPDDAGGYISIGANEYVVESVENQQFNIAKIYNNLEFDNYKARGELMSKDGDSYQNSYQVLVHYYKDDGIAIELNRNELRGVQIPVGIFFKALGCTRDSDIFDIIAPKSMNNVDTVRNILKNAMTTASYNKERVNQSISSDDALMFITRQSYNNSDRRLDMSFDDYTKLTAKSINDMFDNQLLIHIGTSPSDRPEKIRFMGTFIKEVLLTSLNIIPQTDRDSYANKRIHSTGENLGKAIKKVFNESVVRDAKTKMMELMAKSHDNIRSLSLEDVIRSDNTKQGSSRDYKFTISLVKAITSTNVPSTVRPKGKTNSFASTLPTKLVQRKNELNMVSMLRQISASESASSSNSKQSERAHEMRRVHFSGIGYVCMGQSSSEGEKVGIDKQLGVYARLSTGSSSAALKQFIKDTSGSANAASEIDTGDLRDTSLYPEHLISNEYADNNYMFSVHVNGHNIGYVVDRPAFMKQYVSLRRAGKLPDRNTTITYDKHTHKIHFFVDYGRLLRPLMIVHNNLDDVSPAESMLVLEGKRKFAQDILITEKDFDKELDELIIEGKIEYISPEEQANMLICPSYNDFVHEKGNITKPYTHVDYYCSNYGIPVLTSVLSNYNQATRNVFQGNQAKQTCGLYSLNWHKRIDKETFIQYCTDTPMVTTFANSLLRRTNGAHIMIAVMCYGGYNQEDSIIVNKNAIDRGLYNGSKFTSVKAEYNQKDKEDGVSNKPEYNRSKLEKYSYEIVDSSGRKDTVVTSTSMARVGSTLEYNDVIIQKFSPDGTVDRKFIDTSVINRDTDISYVQDSIKTRDADNVNVAKVSIRKPRPVSIGDKFSSRSGQKGICAYLMDEADLPFTEHGSKPDVIFNPQGFPTRMTMAQLYEPVINTYCAIMGVTIDASPFSQINIEEINTELEKYGIKDYGEVEMFSGMTGEKFEARIFFCPLYYQRLQKFVDDSAYCVKDARIDAVTRQPTDGMKDSGGLRMGEMEKDVVASHGSVELLHEKFTDHSDGFRVYKCKCGRTPVVNHAIKKYECPYCGDNTHIVEIPSTYTANMLQANLVGANVDMIFETEKPTEFVETDYISNLEYESEYEDDDFTDEDEEAVSSDSDDDE